MLYNSYLDRALKSDVFLGIAKETSSKTNIPMVHYVYVYNVVFWDFSYDDESRVD